jgi:hypothetical protein
MLASPASAHTPVIHAGCVNNEPTLSINLSAYDKGSNGKSNTVTAVEDGKVTLLPVTKFQSTYNGTFNSGSNPSTGDATTDHSYVVTVKAWDDVDGSKGWSKTLTASSPTCVTPPPTTTTTVPPTTTTTVVAPPTSTTSSISPTTGSATTTSSGAVVAPTTTNGPGGGLAYTGVSTALPLGIAGVLVVAGGGLLLWIRMSAKRRTS